MNNDLQKLAVKGACALLGGVAGFGLGMLAGPIIVGSMGAYAGYRAGDYINEGINVKKARDAEEADAETT